MYSLFVALKQQQRWDTFKMFGPCQSENTTCIVHNTTSVVKVIGHIKSLLKKLWNYLSFLYHKNIKTFLHALVFIGTVWSVTQLLSSCVIVSANSLVML